MILRAIYLSLTLFVFSHLTLSAMNLDIDFQKEYRKSMARRLINHYKDRNYTKAVEFLDKVMAEEKDDKSRQFFSALKIVAIGCQKGRAQEALEQVSTLKVKALQGYCRYRILSEHKKYDVIADKYLDEDISLWPAEFRASGYIIRGKIYQDRVDKKKLAIADYEKAVAEKKMGNFKKVFIYLNIARLKEHENLEAAKMCFEEAHNYFLSNMTRHLTSNLYNRLILQWAQLLEKLNEDRELIEVLNKFNGKNPKLLKKVLAAKAVAYGRLGDTAKQKLYQSYRENFIKNLTKKESLK